MSTNFSQWAVLCIHFFEGCRQCIFLFQSLLCYPRKIRIRAYLSTFDKITVHLPLDMCENVARRSSFYYPALRDFVLCKPLLDLRRIRISRQIRQFPHATKQSAPGSFLQCQPARMYHYKHGLFFDSALCFLFLYGILWLCSRRTGTALAL